jgi:ribosomal protein L28
MKPQKITGRKTLPVPSTRINKEKCKRWQELNLNKKEFPGIRI